MSLSLIRRKYIKRECDNAASTAIIGRFVVFAPI